MLTTIISFLYDFAVWLVLFATALGVSMRFGIDSLRMIVFALYMTVLVWLMFPYHNTIASMLGDTPFVRVTLFVLFACLVGYLISFAIRRSFEKPFEFFHKKIVYALACSILIIIIAVHTLSVGAPYFLNSALLAMLFGNTAYAFYWFLAPLFLVTLI